MRTEGVFVRAAVVALETSVLAIGYCGWVLCELLLLWKSFGSCEVGDMTVI